MRLKVVLVLLFLCLALTGLGRQSYAGAYSYFIGDLYSYYGMISYCVSSINLIGFNETQGFAKILPSDVSMTYYSSNGGRYRTYLNYTLPDDGSYWRVQGNLVLCQVGSGSPEGGIAYTYLHYKIDTANSTSGTFTGYSPRTATDSANTAAYNAASAYNAANAARSSAETAAANAASTLSAVSGVNGNTVTAVRDAGGTVLESARLANTKLDNLQTAVTHIQNNLGAGDTTSPVVAIRTFSGARATSGSSIQAVLDVYDNQSMTFSYSLDGTVYHTLNHDGVVSLPVNSQGYNLIPVWVKDQSGNVTKVSISVRKL